MSRQWAAGDLAAMRRTLALALRQVTVITVPATVGMIALREPIMAVLFERGAFDVGSTLLSASALAGFAAGLVAVAAARILAPGFYALQDTRTPVLVAVVGVVVNLAACLALRGPLGVLGIGLANSIAAAVGALLLLALLRRRLGRIEGWSLLGSTLRIAAAAAALAVVLRFLVTPWADGSATSQAVDLLVRIVAGGGVYFVALAALRAPEIEELREMVIRRRPGTLGTGDGEPGRTRKAKGPEEDR
jgi:putative peptidoglycan lipid II flippase